MSNSKANAKGNVPQDIVNILSENNAPKLGVTIKRDGLGSVVFTGVPEVREFARRAQSLSGDKQAKGVWVFPIDVENDVREMLKDRFDIPVAPPARIRLPYEKESRPNPARARTE